MTPFSNGASLLMTNNAAPSPILIPSLSSQKGLHIPVLIDAKALNPLMVSLQRLSTPPQITTSAKSAVIKAFALMRALALEVHAVEIL